MTQSPFNYTERDYLSLREQLKNYLHSRIPTWTADASDFGYILVEAMAYMGDLLSYYVDLAAQESNILSANSPANVFAHAELYGYQPGNAQSAETDLVLTLPDSVGVGSVVVPAGSQAFDPATGQVFETVEEITLTSGSQDSVTAWQGTTREEVIGVSTGAPGQRLPIPLEAGTYVDGRDSTLWATVASTYQTNTWQPTQALLDQGPSDQVFAVLIDSQGNAFVLFGDGVSGAIPPTGSTITLHYRQCTGIVGNGVSDYSITQWMQSYDEMSDLTTVTVTNPSAPVAGVDIEAIDSVREQAVKFAKAQRRAVTTDDFARIALSRGEVLTAVADSRVWTRPLVWVMPRDEQVLYEASPTRRDRILDDLGEQITSMAMIGTTPTVQFGAVSTVDVVVEVRVWEPVDLRRAASFVRRAIIDNFSYDDVQFEREITEDYILRLIRDNVDDSIVRFARVTRIDGPSLETEDIAAYNGVSTAYSPSKVLGVRPKPGYVLRVDENSLTVVVVGTGTIYVDGTNYEVDGV